jgi:hypothetical protein
MRLTRWLGSSLLALVAAVGFSTAGCGKAEDGGTQAKKQSPGTQDSKMGHTHDEWWCAEHGVPEEECSACDPELAKKFKDKKFKGKRDWCDKHEIAASQCFVCNPEQQEVYARKYREKYQGKEPPPIEEKN